MTGKNVDFQSAHRGIARCWRGHYDERALVAAARRNNDICMSSPVMPTPGIPDSAVPPSSDYYAPSGGAPGVKTAIDETKFRAILGRFTTGVVAVTALPEQGCTPAGLAVNSFTSVSLQPALVLICIARSSTSWPHVRSAARFCINILGEDQREISKRLATSGTDKFRGVRWTTTPNRTPILDGAIGWLECSIEAEYPAGDHTVVVARVHHLDADRDGAPLVFYRGSYGRLGAAY
jgi:3-hydroxy-9,10-secoandrosta-1,3,5(10)-triene-9,17-dione monooxygenase reductase component